MRRLHIILGIVVFVVFLITGQFMEAIDKDTITPDLRLLMRSRHIYIIFNAMIHLALGAYISLDTRAWRKWLQIAGSLLITLGSVFLIWAFFVETFQSKTFSDISR